RNFPIAKVERLLHPLAVEGSLHPDRTPALLGRPQPVRARLRMASPEVQHPTRVSQTGTHLEREVFNLRNLHKTKQEEVWRRGESNPRPKSATARSLHA